MADESTGSGTDTSDKLAEPRDAVARAIVELQGFVGTAGSPEMQAVTSAIEYLGYAYSCLRVRSSNPAWS